MNISKKMMPNPIVHVLKPEELTLDGIKQYYINVEKNYYKFDTLCELYDKLLVSQSIIYVNSKNAAMTLRDLLLKKGHTISVIHGGLRTDERNSVMKQFRSGKTRILISTDLLSRGIDIQQISIVINYELPHEKQLDSYVHRIGRSGRFGRKGVAINFVTDRDIQKVMEIQKIYCTVIEEMPANVSEILMLK
jgi:translation initiation factor 4A